MINKGTGAFVALLLGYLLAVISISVRADSERIDEYEYDGTGNIISIHSGRNLGPPNVTALNPAFVNQGSSNNIEAVGVNLYKAQVTISYPGVSISNVETSETSVTFRISASDQAAIGNVPITFTTRLGSDTKPLAVVERTPVISTDPNPIVLAPNLSVIEVRLLFDQPYSTDQTYDIAISDTTKASVQEQTVTLPAGGREVSVHVAGVAVGTTQLEINQLSNFLALGIPVIVIDQQLPAGDYIQYSRPVGVTTYIDQPFNTSGPFISPSVGVTAFIDKSFDTNGPFVTPLVGVSTFTDQTFSTNGPFVTPLVGVSTFIDQTYSTNGPFVTAIVGTTLGTVVDQVTPQSISRSSSATLTVNGLELNAVTAVSFGPADGITLAGAFTVNTDGTQMTIPIDVSSGAATGIRPIIFTTPAGDEVYPNGFFSITN